MPESVISCQKAREWTAPDGVVKPVYAIGLSDGRGGESFKEIPIGTPVSELQIEQNQYGLKIKWNKAGGGQAWGGGGGSKRGGNESFALSYSKDLVVAGKVDLKDILKTADKFYDWFEGKKPKATQAPAAPAPQTYRAPAAAPAPAPVASSNSNDDLPF